MVPRRAAPRAPRSAPLNCPGCGTAVADGTTICPKCDYIIDSSFLAGDASAEPDAEPLIEQASGANSTFVGPPPTERPKRKPTTGAVKAAAPAGAAKAGPPRKATGSVPRAKPAAAPGAAPAQPRAVRAPISKPKPAPEPQPEPDEGWVVEKPPEPEPDWRMPRDANPPRERSPGASGYRVKHGLEAQEQELSELRNFITGLSRPDQLAFWGATLVVLMAFFPWKETVQEGDVMGLMSLGVIAVGAAALTMGAVVVRLREVFPRLSPIVPWLVQLCGACFGVIWCLVFIRLSYNGQRVQALVGNTEVQISSPSFGAWIALIGFGASAAGTLMGLREKPH